MYDGVKFYFIAPEVVRMGDDIKEFLDTRNISWEEVDDLSQVGVLYFWWQFCFSWFLSFPSLQSLFELWYQIPG